MQISLLNETKLLWFVLHIENKQIRYERHERHLLQAFRYLWIGLIQTWRL